MSLLGIDVGTTGCKAVVFSGEGAILASAYSEYDVARPQPGQATLDSSEVWAKIKSTIARAVVDTPPGDPIAALSVASMGEAVVPVSKERRILGPSILIVDNRGAEQAARLRGKIDDISCYEITGNPVGNQYGLTKLMWLKESEPKLYDETYRFLNWAGFVSFMLGAEPHADFSLANRMLLFDLERETWSDEMLAIAELDREKLPDCVASGSPIGTVDPKIADELHLPRGVLIAAGAHDQCANSLGSGSLHTGCTVWGPFPLSSRFLPKESRPPR